jgi:hypothetical protein
MKNTGRRSTPSHEHKKKDLSKIKCCNCSTFGHYASNCPKKNGKENQHASTTDVDESQPRKKIKAADEYTF